MLIPIGKILKPVGKQPIPVGKGTKPIGIRAIPIGKGTKRLTRKSCGLSVYFS